MGRVKRPVQRVIVIALALMLVVPVGVIGIGQLLGPGPEEQAIENPDERPTADPAEQPPKPDLPRPEEPAGLTEQSADSLDGRRITVRVGAGEARVVVPDGLLVRVDAAVEYAGGIDLEGQDRDVWLFLGAACAVLRARDL